MKPQRPASRRSFLVRVGAVAGAGAALALVGGSELRAQNYSGVTDCDTGNGSDRPGFGRGNRNAVTDRDTGPNGDPRCRGRGTSGATGHGQYGSGQPETRCSDRDYGPNGDPGGRGRTCRGYGPNHYAPQVSGCTDSDTGQNADSIGNGRRCTPR